MTHDANAMVNAKPSYDWWNAKWGDKCRCGHTKDQHAHPGALGTLCGEPCGCQGFRRSA